MIEDEGPDLPSPPAAAHDLRYFAVIEFEPTMLTGPAFSGLSDAGFRAQIMLAAAAWREVPAGSLSPCETTLALLAGCGRDMAAWLAVREEVLAHWEYCNDGRLWFAPMAGAVEGAAARLKGNRMADAARKARQRMRAELRAVGVVVPDAELDPRLDDAIRAMQRRGGASLRGQRRAEEAAAVASELGLLPRAGGDLGARFARGPRPVGAVLRGQSEETG